MNFTEAISVCFSKYFTFEGRARRSEYWYFYLFTMIGNIIFTVIDTLLFPEIEILSSVFSLAVTIPTLAAGSRRLHDTNRSGWFQLLPIAALPLFIPALMFMESNETLSIVFLSISGLVVVGLSILLLVWYASDSDPGFNRFGHSPKGGNHDSVSGENYESIFE